MFDQWCLSLKRSPSYFSSFYHGKSFVCTTSSTGGVGIDIGKGSESGSPDTSRNIRNGRFTGIRNGDLCGHPRKRCSQAQEIHHITSAPHSNIERCVGSGTNVVYMSSFYPGVPSISSPPLFSSPLPIAPLLVRQKQWRLPVDLDTGSCMRGRDYWMTQSP